MERCSGLIMCKSSEDMGEPVTAPEGQTFRFEAVLEREDGSKEIVGSGNEIVVLENELSKRGVASAPPDGASLQEIAGSGYDACQALVFEDALKPYQAALEGYFGKVTAIASRPQEALRHVQQEWQVLETLHPRLFDPGYIIGVAAPESTTRKVGLRYSVGRISVFLSRLGEEEPLADWTIIDDQLDNKLARDTFVNVFRVVSDVLSIQHRNWSEFSCRIPEYGREIAYFTGDRISIGVILDGPVTRGAYVKIGDEYRKLFSYLEADETYAILDRLVRFLFLSY